MDTARSPSAHVVVAASVATALGSGLAAGDSGAEPAGALVGDVAEPASGATEESQGPSGEQVTWVLLDLPADGEGDG